VEREMMPFTITFLPEISLVVSCAGQNGSLRQGPQVVPAKDDLATFYGEEIPMRNYNDMVEINGPTGAFWMRSEGIDPGRNKIFFYKDQWEQFYFSMEMVIHGPNGPFDVRIIHARALPGNLGSIVVLGSEIERIKHNIELFFKTRNFHFPEQFLADPTHGPKEIIFAWGVR
jgi:hypothetical protein